MPRTPVASGGLPSRGAGAPPLPPTTPLLALRPRACGGPNGPAASCAGTAISSADRAAIPHTARATSPQVRGSSPSGPQIRSVLSFLEPALITRSRRKFCHAEPATQYLNTHGIRISKFPEFVREFRHQIRSIAEAPVEKAGLRSEFLAETTPPKKERIEPFLAQRGTHSGLLHIFRVLKGYPSL